MTKKELKELKKAAKRGESAEEREGLRLGYQYVRRYKKKLPAAWDYINEHYKTPENPRKGHPELTIVESWEGEKGSTISVTLSSLSLSWFSNSLNGLAFTIQLNVI